MQFELHDLQSGPKSDTLLVSEIPFLLDAFYLQFVLTHESFSLNHLVLRLPI